MADTLPEGTDHIAPGAGSGSIIGAAPILQPFRMQANGRSYFVQMMKPVVDFAAARSSRKGTRFQVVDASGSVRGELVEGLSLRRQKRPRHVPSAFIAAGATGLSEDNVSGLLSQAYRLTVTTWPYEPVNWTTHALHLTSTGHLLHAKDMPVANASGATVVLAERTVTLQAAPRPVATQFQGWNRAGRMHAQRLARSSGSSDCDDDSHSSSGGTSSGSSSSSGTSGGSSTYI